MAGGGADLEGLAPVAPELVTWRLLGSGMVSKRRLRSTPAVFMVCGKVSKRNKAVFDP